ncbi:MAG: hypothetical protein FWG99_11680, partial [Treponema sp.]|nr:hypothetical protein [Treponema sp.]
FNIWGKIVYFGGFKPPPKTKNWGGKKKKPKKFFSPPPPPPQYTNRQRKAKYPLFLLKTSGFFPMEKYRFF